MTASDPVPTPVLLDEELREAVARAQPAARQRGCVIGVLVRDGVPSGLLVPVQQLREELDSVIGRAVDHCGRRMMAVMEFMGFDAQMNARVRVVVLSPMTTSISWNGAFPIARAPTLEPPPTPRVGIRALVVDDDPVSREVLCGMLLRTQAQAQAVDRGVQALEVLARQPMDVVLLDMSMPGMSGQEVARTLRRQGNRVPILGVSANRFADDREDCISAGMNDYMSKPVQPATLMRMVERWTR